MPAHAPGGAAWGVVRLTGDHDYQVVFQVDAKDWAELCQATCMSGSRATC